MNNPIPDADPTMEPWWSQAHKKEIFFAEDIAILSLETFNKLISSSYRPPLLYVGKMWKGFIENTNYWYLYWYDGIEIQKREIKIMDWRNLMNI